MGPAERRQGLGKPVRTEIFTHRSCTYYFPKIGAGPATLSPLSDDLGKKLEELALLGAVQRLQRLARDGRSVEQQLVHDALAVGGEAEQRAPRIAGIGTRVDETTLLQPTHHALHGRLVHADESAEKIL